MYLAGLILITASVAAKLYCEAKTIPRFVPGVRMCAQMLFRRNEKKKVSPTCLPPLSVLLWPDLGLKGKLAVFFRSRLAKWEWRLEQIFAAVLQLETTFTSLAYITHIPLFLDIPKNLGTLPRIWKTMTRQNRRTNSLFYEWRGGEKREDWTASSTQLAFSNNVTPHETATEKQQ